MTILSSRVSTSDDEFRLNREAYEAVIANLQSRRQLALAGGPLKAREKHLARNKILPRHRVEVLLDPGSPFLEVGMLAGEGMYDGVPPGASIITGIGLVQGRACMIIANDATVKGGTYYGMTCKKHVRAQQIAGHTACPASRWWTVVAPSCRKWPTSFPMWGSSAAFSTTRFACRPKASSRLPW